MDPWDVTLLELGYINCRPCNEWHRPPECAIDTEGFALRSCGCRWEDGDTHRAECALAETPDHPPATLLALSLGTSDSRTSCTRSPHECASPADARTRTSPTAPPHAVTVAGERP